MLSIPKEVVLQKKVLLVINQIETHLSNLLIQNLYAIVLKKMVVVMILALNGGY